MGYAALPQREMRETYGSMEEEVRPLTAGFWPQLKATIVRNILRKKGNKKHTLREILGPLYFMAIIIILKLTLPSPYHPPVLTTAPTTPQDITLEGALHGKRIVFAPSDKATLEFMAGVEAVVGDKVTFVPMQSEEAILAEYEANFSSVYMGLVFNSTGASLSYKVRLSSSASSLSYTGVGYHLPGPEPQGGQDTCRQSQGGVLQDPVTCPTNAYYYSGFTAVQSLIDNTWLKAKAADDFVTMKLKVKPLPKPGYSGTLETVLRAMIPIYMTFSMAQFIGPMLMVVVDEKEKRIKESLRMVGLRDSVFWLSWFLVYATLISCTSLLGSVLINFIVFNTTKSYYWILLALMVSFGFSIIMFAFMLTAIFSKAKTAGAVGGLSMMLVATLYYLQVFLPIAPDSSLFWLVGLLSPPTFAMAMDQILKFDITGVPVSWEVLWSTEVSGLPIAGCLIMLLVDSLLYGVLAAWLDNIIPTEYGSQRPPWFCLMPSYWCPAPLSPPSGRPPTPALEDPGDIEPIAADMMGKEAIVIRDLRKTFSGLGKETVKAVQGVNLDIYPGQITAILGHNGAGKSTLFNMLTGMCSSTSGSATIFGYDIKDPDQMVEIRKMTGICPQHDVLFDELTPRQHLTYFARIRGILPKEVAGEVEAILRDTDLGEKADSRASDLSGGQKRKLSVGIALIGDPKLIFLDEPTAGVDPYSRRHLWDVLKRRKEGKVILLTTHFMDEADILADRKAIMSHGVIRCFGSSLFLKNKFGLGYHLTMVLKSGNKATVAKLREKVQATVTGAEQARLFGREVSFVLPREEVAQFPGLFKQVEKEIAQEGELGISSYGVSMTTLEEVFLHLGEEEEQEEKGATPALTLNGSAVVNGSAPVNGSADTLGFSFQAAETHKSAWQMFWALTYLRFIMRFREPAMFFVQIVMPIIYISLGVFLSNLSKPSAGTSPSVDLSPSLYTPVYQPLYGYWPPTPTSSPPDFLDFLEDYTGQPLKTVNSSLDFPDLLGQDLVTMLQEDDGDTGFLAYFNTTAQHSLPVLVNSFSNAQARQLGLQGNITVSSQSFRKTTVAPGFDGSSFGGNMLVGITYVFIPCGFALELIYDREIRARNQLRVNGLTFTMYFGTFFVVLGGLLLLLLCILLTLVWAFSFEALLLPPAFLLLSSMYFLYIPPALFFTATVSYLFDTIESGQFIFALASWGGMIPYFAVMLTASFQVLDGALARWIHIVFAFVSPVYIPFGIIYYIQRQFTECSVTDSCSTVTVSDYLVPEVWVLYVALAFHTVFWALGLRVADVMKDGGTFASVFRTDRVRPAPNSDSIEDEDEDVKQERKVVVDVMEGRQEGVIAVEGLRKEYSGERKGCRSGTKLAKVAVRNLSLQVGEGEVVGLLGHNGAGKTTTMRMVIQEEGATRGRVRIGQEEIMSNQAPAFQQLGYCPQFDAVWQRVTVREHLALYAAIRGVDNGSIPDVVSSYLAGLRIQEHADKYSKDCSGGTKRKLSYAMSMLGQPRIVLLDEPSTGMDPQSKRFVWDTIEASFRPGQGRGAVLTTHSMEEADALCSRVGIMVKGELRCLGSTQHLKNKYGAGYQLEVKWQPGGRGWDGLEEHLTGIFPGAQVLEEFSERRTYSVEQSQVSSLADAFSQLEQCKEQWGVEDYSLSQTTLEQVFIEFAKQQEAPDADAETDRSRPSSSQANKMTPL